MDWLSLRLSFYDNKIKNEKYIEWGLFRAGSGASGSDDSGSEGNGGSDSSGSDGSDDSGSDSGSGSGSGRDSMLMLGGR